jgi:hypothetical protein
VSSQSTRLLSLFMGELLPVGPYLDLRMLSADQLGLVGYDPAMLGQRFNLRNLAFAGLHTETVKHAWGQFICRNLLLYLKNLPLWIDRDILRM